MKTKLLLKKTTALLSLFSYLTLMAITTIAFSPIANAADCGSDGTPCICNFSGEGSEYPKPFETEEKYEEYKKTDAYSEFEKKFGESLINEGKDLESSEDDTATGICGEPNAFTGFLEKGDCTAEGYLITELSEIIGSDTSTDTAKIITVYKGGCCLYTIEEGNQCKDSRYIYTTGENGYTDCTASAINCEKRQWIIAQSGVGILKVYVKQLYRWASITVGFIAVITIVISGIQISVSGVSGDISSAKNRILKSIAGIVLLFLSGIILYTINPTFFS